MQFGHEQSHVYQVSVRYVAWAYEVAESLKGIDSHARDQLLRASQSIPLDIAEGNGKGTHDDRRGFFEIGRGPALECASIQGCLEACDVLSVARNAQRRTMLTRIVSMLTELGRRNHEVREVTVSCSGFDYGNDYDNDNDQDNE
jgi:four helix bundle protein